MTLLGYMLDIEGLQKTGPAFQRALFEQARAAGYEPSYLAAVMSFESGFDPHVQNRGGAPAWGLIQFWEPAWKGAAARLGRAGLPFPSALLSMSAVEQLPFVIAYYDGTPLKPIRARATPADYYLATFMPALVGAPPSFVLGVKDSTQTLKTPSGANTGLSLGKVYAQNAGLDADRKGTITVAETVAPVTRRVEAASLRPLISVWGEPGELRTGSPPPSSQQTAPPYLMSSAGLLFFCPSCGAHSNAVAVRPDPAMLSRDEMPRTEGNA